MRHYFLLIVVLFFVSPVFSFAEGNSSFIASRYCPDPANDFFKGNIYHTDDGKPWVEVKVDPGFEQKELRGKRKITGDIPLTPVYDLVIRIKPEFNYYCIPGWAGSAAPVTAEQLPEDIPIGGFFTIGAQNEKLTDKPGEFSRTNEKDEQGRFIYEWKELGWPKGIVATAQLKQLIAELSKKQPMVNVFLEIYKNDVMEIKKKEIAPVSFTMCVPIWGSGRHKITGLYAAETLQNTIFSSPVEHFDTLRSGLFAKTPPLSLYQSLFSYFVDLHTRSAHTYDPILKIWLIHGLDSISYKDRESLLSYSSCGQDGIFLFSLPDIISEGVAVSRGDVKGAALGVGLPPTAYLHEFAHAFARLDDEYLYSKYGVPRMNFFSYDFHNCSANPASSYKHQNKLYGATSYTGCMFEAVAEPVALGKTGYFFRPSKNSLMNNPPQDSFNVVSCGYLMSAILDETTTKENAEKYWPSCAQMNGINTDGVEKSALSFASFLSWLTGNNSQEGKNLTAQISSAVSNSQQSEYVIVEDFDPNDRWGTLVEVVPDSKAAIPVPSASKIPPQVSGLDDVSDDSIFDTLSVDLKVNGSDGPVELGKRDHIVLSWISEGATRCRGVWSKNDIKLSGTASGRITKPVTIKVACIDGDGNRADDAVQVDVIN